MSITNKLFNIIQLYLFKCGNGTTCFLQTLKELLRFIFYILSIKLKIKWKTIYLNTIEQNIS